MSFERGFCHFLRKPVLHSRTHLGDSIYNFVFSCLPAPLDLTSYQPHLILCPIPANKIRPSSSPPAVQVPGQALALPRHPQALPGTPVLRDSWLASLWPCLNTSPQTWLESHVLKTGGSGRPATLQKSLMWTGVGLLPPTHRDRVCHRLCAAWGVGEGRAESAGLCNPSRPSHQLDSCNLRHRQDHSGSLWMVLVSFPVLPPARPLFPLLQAPLPSREEFPQLSTGH